MSLQLVAPSDYTGTSGLHHLRRLQGDLAASLVNEDWRSIRRLDQSCHLIVDKVIAANTDDGIALILALVELKELYAQLVARCHSEVTAIAR